MNLYICTSTHTHTHTHAHTRTYTHTHTHTYTHTHTHAHTRTQTHTHTHTHTRANTYAYIYASAWFISVPSTTQPERSIRVANMDVAVYQISPISQLIGWAQSAFAREPAEKNGYVCVT